MVTLSLTFFLKKIRSQFKETVISVQIALTVLTGYFLTAERNYSFRGLSAPPKGGRALGTKCSAQGGESPGD